MMSRSFTRREKILILVLCVLLLGVIYYKFVIQDVNERIERYNVEELETDLLLEQTKALSISRMKEEMAANKSSSVGIVASYNNIKNEIRELNDIFASASSYNLDFAQAVQDEDAVRRDIRITFSASSYSNAESIIKALDNCKYRCLVRNISISTGGSGNGISSSSVSVSMTVTFFETMYNADTTDGLEVMENEAETSETTEE